MKLFLTFTLLVILSSCREDQQLSPINYSGIHQVLNKANKYQPIYTQDIVITIWGDSAVLYHSSKDNESIDTLRDVIHTDTTLDFISSDGGHYSFKIKNDSINSIIDNTRFILSRVRAK